MTRNVFAVSGAESEPARRITLAEAGLREVEHLQRWVLAHPEILGDELLVLTAEFNRWQTSGGIAARERLDVLALESSGRLVVVELKRAGDRNIHIQAITYAALVSGFDVDTLADVHAEFLRRSGNDVTAAAAEQLMRAHVDGDWDTDILSVPRIVLLAEAFPPQVITSVLWLTRQGLTIDLVEASGWSTDAQVTIVFDHIFPEPGVAELLLEPARRDTAQAVAKAQERTRAASSSRIIVEEGLLAPGTILTFQVTSEVDESARTLIRQWIDEDPDRRGRAEWVADALGPLRWKLDGQTHTPSGLANLIIKEATGMTKAVRGTTWWVDEDGRDLVVLSGAASGVSGRDWSDLHDLLALVRPGEWTSYGELGKAIGLPAQPIGGHITSCRICPDGHRVLTVRGAPANGFQWADPDETRDCVEVLMAEGLSFTADGLADPTRRVGADILRQRLEARP